MAWTDIDEKNEFKLYTNKLIGYVDSCIIKLRNVTNNNLDASNIATIYRDKMFALENDFANHGINFFDKIVLRKVIDKYLLNLLDESIKSVDKTSKKLMTINGLYLFDKSSILANKIVDGDLKKYEQTCSKIENFNMKSNILSALILYFSNDKYYIFTPGEFTKQYEQVKAELSQLGLADLIPTIDEKLLPLIKKQELASAKFNDLTNVEKPKTK